MSGHPAPWPECARLCAHFYGVCMPVSSSVVFLVSVKGSQISWGDCISCLFWPELHIKPPAMSCPLCTSLPFHRRITPCEWLDMSGGLIAGSLMVPSQGRVIMRLFDLATGRCLRATSCVVHNQDNLVRLLASCLVGCFCLFAFQLHLSTLLHVVAEASDSSCSHSILAPAVAFPVPLAARSCSSKIMK